MLHQFRYDFKKGSTSDVVVRSLHANRWWSNATLMQRHSSHRAETSSHLPSVISKRVLLLLDQAALLAAALHRLQVLTFWRYKGTRFESSRYTSAAGPEQGQVDAEPHLFPAGPSVGSCIKSLRCWFPRIHFVWLVLQCDAKVLPQRCNAALRMHTGDRDTQLPASPKRDLPTADMRPRPTPPTCTRYWRSLTNTLS